MSDKLIWSPEQIDMAIVGTASMIQLVGVDGRTPIGDPQAKGTVWMATRDGFWKGHDTVREDSPKAKKDEWVSVLGMLAALEERTKFDNGEGDLSLFKQFLTLANSRTEALSLLGEDEAERAGEALVEEFGAGKSMPSNYTPAPRPAPKKR